jgi:hypothetical protein
LLKNRRFVGKIIFLASPVCLAVLTSLMLPPATLPASSASQRLAVAGKYKKIWLFFCFLFPFLWICRATNVRRQRKNSLFFLEKSLS